MFKEGRKEVDYDGNSYLSKTLVWMKFHEFQKYVKSGVGEI